eukprot:TRINITY_DN2966_c0_g2_i3.p1 TRINITY_DN2966_c0_g2~~TRINITY_DN2966_c0_g2_i3.p1  ORF type:complete len:272 (-),score=76.34 TRINITY_DN2966_c0_g2_i3:2529-3344(-)
MAEETTAIAEKKEEVDEEDPDYLEAHPPEEIPTPQQHFELGSHAGKWSEYDERGVPIKNMSKKKPSRKEKESMEAEYMEAKRKYQQYLKDVAIWDDKKVEAERLLQKKDPMRWAFRRVGPDKHAPVPVIDLKDFYSRMGWDAPSWKEMLAIKKAALRVADEDECLSLEVLREFVKHELPRCLLESRLEGNLNDIDVLDTFSPRGWRRVIEAQGFQLPKKDRRTISKDKGSKDSSGSKERRQSRSPSPSKERTGEKKKKEKKEKKKKADSDA